MLSHNTIVQNTFMSLILTF